MRKARVLITDKCYRNCDGCCNKDFNIQSLPIFDFDRMNNYSEILITGGEPFLDLNQVLNLLKYDLKDYNGKIYLYSAYLPISSYQTIIDILHFVQGFHFTLHHPAKDNDINALKFLSDTILYHINKAEINLRLAIDSRVYDEYDLSNIDFKYWNVVRKMKWKSNCPLPEGEVLFKLF